MRKSSIYYLKLIFLFLLLLTIACEPRTDKKLNDTLNNGNSADSSGNVPRQYWGAWLNVHTGEKVFFDAETKFGNFEAKSSNLVFADGHYYIRASLSDTKVEGKVSYVGLLKSQGLTNIADVNTILERIRKDGSKDRNIRREKKPDNNGNVEFTVPGGSNYIFRGEDSAGNSCEVKVYVEGDKTEVGNCTLRPSSDYNLKAQVYVEARDTDAGFLYGDLYTYESYRNHIRITNIGDSAVTGVTVKIVVNSPYVDMFEYNCNGETKYSGDECVIGSIEPNNSKDIGFKIRFKYLDDWERTVKIEVYMKDPVFNREFYDYAFLNVYKRPVYFNFNSDGNLNGYLVLKGRKVVRVSRRPLRIPFLPNETYYLYLSNPQGYEAKYSIGLDAPAPSLDNYTSEDVSRFEPNDTEADAKTLKIGDSVRAYLHASSESIDMDIFKIVMREEDLNTDKAVDLKFAEYKVYDNYDICNYSRDYFYIDRDGDGNYTESVCIKGNGNGIVDRGEKVLIQLAIKNMGNSEAYGVTLDLKSNDSYIKVYRVADKNGNVRNNVINVIYSGETRDSDGDASYDYLTYLKSYGQFFIEVDPSVPVPYTANLDLTIKDRYGNEWHDTVPVEIKPVSAKYSIFGVGGFYEPGRNSWGDCIKQVSVDIDNDGINETVCLEGNNNKVLNPGENAIFRVAVQNTGSDTGIDITLKPTTNDPYVNVFDLSSLIRTLAPGEIKDSAGVKKEDWGYLDEANGTLLIMIDPNTPSGHTATVNLEIKDAYGNTYTDSFEVNVQ